MKLLSRLLKNNKGESLVEVLIATGVLVIISSAIIASLYSSGNVTESNKKMRVNYETSVGTMDTYISGADTSIGTDVSINITFPNDTDENVDCVQIYEGDLPMADPSADNQAQRTGITKKK